MLHRFYYYSESCRNVTCSERSHPFRSLLRYLIKTRKYTAVIFITLILSVVYLYASQAISPEGENESVFATDGMSLTVSPTTLFLTPFHSGGGQIQIYGTIGGVNASSISVVLFSGSFSISVQESIQIHNGYMRAYLHLSNADLKSHELLGFFEVDNKSEFIFHVKVDHTPLPLLTEVLTGLAALFYFITLASWNMGSRRILLFLIPLYIAFAALFGQRYDTFFMISSGIRAYDGVNPFVPSNLFPASLKWEYPPLFIPYSVFSYLIVLLSGQPAISNNILNFIGAESGFTYMAWRSLSGPSLIPYYLLIKIPMIASTLGLYRIMVRRAGIDHAIVNRYWLLNPYIIVVAIAWGQLDVLSSLFLVWSIIELKRGSTGTAAVFTAIGTSFKIFPVFLLPLIISNSRKRLRDIGFFAMGLAPNLIIYKLTGTLFYPLSELLFSRSVPTFYGIFSSNGVSWQVILNIIGIRSFPSLFLYVFIPLFAIFTFFYITRLRNGNPALFMIVVISLFFLTYNYVNPQYFIWLIPLLLIENDLWHVAVFSLIPMVYLFLTYRITYFINPYLSFNYFSSPLGQLEVTRVSLLSGLLIPFIIMVNAFILYFLYKKVSSLFREPLQNVAR